MTFVRWFAIVAGALVVLVVTAGFVLRDRFERLALESSLQRATGYSVTLDDTRHEGAALVILGLHAHSHSGAVVLDVPRVDVTSNDRRIAAIVDRPHVTLLLDRWRGDERETLEAGLHTLHIDSPDLDADLRAGDVLVARGVVPELAVAFTDLRGSVRVHEGVPAYTLGLALADGSARYPISATTESREGVQAVRWDAAALPLAPLASVIPADAPVQIRGGWLSGVSLTYGSEPLSVKATIDGGELELRSGTTHELSGVTGDLELGSHSLGSSGLRASLDGVPFDYVGEVGDIRSRLAWLEEGTPDLRRLGRLMFSVAAEPKLQSMHLEWTAPGLGFSKYSIQTENGPLTISALLVNPREPTLRFDTAIAEDHIFSNGERTSAMGVRTHAIAGVNGDYFDIGRTYQPQGMLIQSGELFRGPTDRYALVVKRDGSVEFHEYKMHGIVATQHGSFPVTQFNNWPAGDVTIVTPRFGKTLPAWPGETFVALSPLDRKPGRYEVRSVVPVDRPVPVSFGLVFGPRLKGPLPRVGDHISLSYALEPSANGVVAGIGGGPLLIKDGTWYEDPHAPAPDERDVRWPVVALAHLSDDLLLLMAVDGRHPERSIGMTRPEFAALLQRFGAIDAMALDSGGSVTLIARAPGDEDVSVRNQPSDSSAERWVSDGLFLYSSAPKPEIVVPRVTTTPIPEARPTP
jgi:exopolysaccharide biosynthesis protein